MGAEDRVFSNCTTIIGSQVKTVPGQHYEDDVISIQGSHQLLQPGDNRLLVSSGVVLQLNWLLFWLHFWASNGQPGNSVYQFL